MTTVTINGNTYSADGSAAKDMTNGGHRTWFIPLVSDVATVAGTVATQAAQTAIDATNAANGAAATRGTSTTSLTVAAGSQSITTQSGKQFVVGNYVTVSRTSAPATLMHGVVTAYSGTALTVDVSTIAGSGTFTDWTIALSGAKGNTGATGNGDIAYLAKTGAYTVTAADKGKLIDCTSGTFTLSFSACATLGANWITYIRNSGTGVITLDPNASETIDGAATFTLNPGASCMVQCDGTALRKAGLYQYDSELFIHTQDQKASGTVAGASSTGENLRQMNTVVSNTLTGASLASNQVTLAAGVYRYEAKASMNGTTTSGRIRLKNVTDSTYLQQGIFAANINNQNVELSVGGVINITASKAFQIAHHVVAGTATYGLGQGLTTGDIEVYADLKIWRIA